MCRYVQDHRVDDDCDLLIVLWAGLACGVQTSPTQTLQGLGGHGLVGRNVEQ